MGCECVRMGSVSDDPKKLAFFCANTTVASSSLEPFGTVAAGSMRGGVSVVNFGYAEVYPTV